MQCILKKKKLKTIYYAFRDSLPTSGCVVVVLRFHLPNWAQERILVEPPGLGLLLSDSELFPWRILMPHLHLGIVKGNGSLTL